ncbi:MAG: hypothetical protein AB7O98_10780 [Hyphomonadaceae bacterium]
MRFTSLAVAFALAILPIAAHGQEAVVATACETGGFMEDDRYRQIAEAYALDAVDAARANFGVALDWSDASVSQVEQMLDIMNDEIGSANPSPETIETFAKMFGSYIGEVYRRNHGATWGLVKIGEEFIPGLQAEGTCALFWPWGRVQNRLVEGDENNVLHYYEALIERNAQ